MDAIDPGAEKQALTELMQSEGWRVFEQMVDQQWGDSATLTMVSHQVRNTAPMGNPEAVKDAAQHILSSQSNIQKVMRLPKDRIKALSEPMKKPSQPRRPRR